MAQVFPQSQQAKILQYLVNQETPEDLILKLYKNDVTPSESSNTSTFTEADFTGYASAELDSADWTITTGDPTVALYDAFVEFESTAGSQNQQIYGYFIVGKTSGDLITAERFPTLPSPITNNGDIISIKPRITLDNA